MNQFFLWQLSTKLLGRPQVQTFRALSKDSRNKTVDQKLTFSYFRCGQNDTFIPKVRFSIFYVGNFKRIKVTFFNIWHKIGELFRPHCHNYHSYPQKTAFNWCPGFTGNVFCVFSRWFLWFWLNFTNFCQKILKLLSLFTFSVIRQNTSSFSALTQKGTT